MHCTVHSTLHCTVHRVHCTPSETLENAGGRDDVRSIDDRLTRMGVARLVGCSKTQVRHYEKVGALHPEVGGDGVRVFQRDEVLALARRSAKRKPKRRGGPGNEPDAPGRREAGDVAAHVFALLKDNWTLPEIVIHTKVPPEQVRKLYDEYRWPLGTQRPEPAGRPVRAPAAAAIEDSDALGRSLPLRKTVSPSAATESGSAGPNAPLTDARKLDRVPAEPGTKLRALLDAILAKRKRDSDGWISKVRPEPGATWNRNDVVSYSARSDARGRDLLRQPGQ